jgi:hypothetical protein
LDMCLLIGVPTLRTQNMQNMSKSYLKAVICSQNHGINTYMIRTFQKIRFPVISIISTSGGSRRPKFRRMIDYLMDCACKNLESHLLLTLEQFEGPGMSPFG